MSASTRLTAACAARWVRCYTTGLSPALRDARRAELASDFWEHTNDPEARHATASLALRCLLGVPADLAWRASHAHPGALIGRPILRLLHLADGMARWLGRRGLPGLALLLAALYLLIGAVLMLAGIAGRHGADGNNLAWGASVCLLCGAAIFAGAHLTPRWRLRGPALLALGAVPMALVLFSTILVPLASLAVVAWAAVRSWRRPAPPPRLL